MDILNFISWIASKRRIVKSLTNSDLIPVGVRNETRDDKYTTVAITAEDFFAQIPAPVPEPVIDSEGNVIIGDSSNNTVLVGPGGTQLIDNFSGMVIINDHYDGGVEIWVAGGGDATMMVHTTAAPGNSTMTINGQGYEWTNVDNLQGPFTFTVIKTRQGS